MSTRLSEREQERTLAMMSTPTDWPAWPVLPLKRSARFTPKDIGLLVAWQGHLTTVYHANIFLLGQGSFEEVFGPLDHTEYTDYASIIDDGWMVD